MISTYDVNQKPCETERITINNKNTIDIDDDNIHIFVLSHWPKRSFIGTRIHHNHSLKWRLFSEFLHFTREHVCRTYIVIHVSLLRESIRKRTKNE